MVLSVPAIAFGLRGRAVARRTPGAPGHGMASWGLGLGIFTLAWPFAVLVIVVVAVAGGG